MTILRIESDGIVSGMYVIKEFDSSDHRRILYHYLFTTEIVSDNETLAAILSSYYICQSLIVFCCFKLSS